MSQCLNGAQTDKLMWALMILSSTASIVNSQIFNLGHKKESVKQNAFSPKDNMTKFHT